MPAPEAPTLRYRADVPWYAQWVARWEAATPAQADLRFEPVANLGHDFEFLEPEAEGEEAPAEGFLPNPQSHGAEALARMRRHLGRAGWLKTWLALPGGATLLQLHHALLFRRPKVVGTLSWLLHASDLKPRTWVWSRWLFMRLLGFVFLVAALSWWSQLDGLVGDNGILPADAWLDRVTAHGDNQGWTGTETWLKVPTLLWFDASDGMQDLFAGTAVAASLLVLFNVLEGLALFLAWGAMLSLMTVGQVFSGYQWDALLLEAGFAGLFVAAWTRWRPGLSADRRESEASLWAVRFLAAKLMFLSGLVKLQSGDLTWANDTAMEYHYWTQPIPSATSWAAHHLPRWVHEVSSWLTVAAELVLPAFVIFGPRRLRLFAALGFIALMLGIALTGNYGFFNLLTIALCLTCIDDQALHRLVPKRWRDRKTPPERQPPSKRAWVAWPLRICAGALIVLSIGRVWMLADRDGTPDWLAEVHADIDQLHISNHYGLFAQMTLDRPEIRVEGSDDGTTWAPYVFKYKPGPLHRTPSIIGPHMPRLDWQMWFAALRGSCQRTRWYLPFVQRLLEGREEVTSMLEANPFSRRPPKYIRSTVYDYYFTTAGEREATGNVWKAVKRGSYCPTLQLNASGRLIQAQNTR